MMKPTGIEPKMTVRRYEPQSVPESPLQRVPSHTAAPTNTAVPMRPPWSQKEGRGEVASEENKLTGLESLSGAYKRGVTGRMGADKVCDCAARGNAGAKAIATASNWKQRLIIR